MDGLDESVDLLIFIPSREIVMKPSPVMARGLNSIRRAFANTFRVTPLPDDSCIQGIHRPAFLVHTWACERCWVPLSLRSRV